MDPRVDDNNQPAMGRRLSVAEFKHSAECFAKAFHASPYVQTVSRFDTGRYLYVNDRFVKTVGYTREEVIGKTSIELGLLPDISDRTWLTQVLRQRGRLTSKRLRFRLRSGDVRIGLLNAEVIHVAGEDCILSTVFDITDQLATEHRYRTQGKRVASIEQLAASLAHEVRGSLTGIKGVADTFLHRRQLTKQEREWMQAVAGEVSKIEARVRELLDLTQSRMLSITPCSLNELIKKVVLLSDLHANSISGREIQIAFLDETNGPLNMALDGAQIEDAILNLVLNAVESIEKNGRVTVRLSRRIASPQFDEAVITVTDTGCGIHVKDRQRIFEPFFTTKREGTGIGLSSVQRTAAAFDGRITFKSHIGRGSSFELSLPLRTTHSYSYER